VNREIDMSSLYSASQDKIVVEVVVEPTSGRILRADDPGFIRARGTRQQFPVLRPLGIVATGTGTIAAQSAPPPVPPAPAPVRDPIAVLRTYPVSTLDREDPTATPRQALRAPSPGAHLDDKIRLAHLALELYSELESTGHACGAPLTASEPTRACGDRRCQARTNALRGALVEACLLVQRVALLSPELDRQGDVVARLRELLSVIEP
jgi:hypothetical protein